MASPSAEKPTHSSRSLASEHSNMSLQPAQKQPSHNKPTPWSNMVDHLASEVKPSMFAEIQLLLLTVCTGIQDATTFPDYHCFASNQTGNTVFLCLAILLPSFNGDMFITANIGVALGVFLGAGWVTGQSSHLIGPRKRWWLFLCNLIQTGAVFGAAAVQYRYGIHVQGPSALAVVSMLAFASGSQVVQSRSLAMTEISTAMATAAWVDLMIDKKLFVLNNRPRTRRIAFLLALVVGALIGAGMYKTVGTAPAILVSAVGKLVVTFLYLLTPCEKTRTNDSAV